MWRISRFKQLHCVFHLCIAASVIGPGVNVIYVVGDNRSGKTGHCTITPLALGSDEMSVAQRNREFLSIFLVKTDRGDWDDQGVFLRLDGDEFLDQPQPFRDQEAFSLRSLLTNRQMEMT